MLLTGVRQLDANDDTSPLHCFGIYCGRAVASPKAAGALGLSGGTKIKAPKTLSGLHGASRSVPSLAD